MLPFDLAGTSALSSSIPAPAPLDDTRKRCFDPVIDAGTRLLILGSLPGEKSLAHSQYYAHPQNRFWMLLGEVLDVDLAGLPYERRLATVLAHGVGLWDVVAQAHRTGSLDSNIRNRDDNDLPGLLARFPGIRAIAFNGGTAAKVGRRILDAGGAHYRIVELPSSSPAYTRPYGEKLQQWLVLRQALA